MYFSRHLLGRLQAAESQGRARLVLGARQTGKSTLFALLKDPDCILIDLQERSERLRFSQDPSLLTRSLLPLGRRRRHVLIDEIQRVPDLLEEVQLILDRHPGRFTFTLTGSSSRRLRRGSANLLPGRARLYPLHPVILPEQELGGRPSGLVLPFPAVAGPLFSGRDLSELLVYGSLPGLWGRMGREDLEAYAALYIEEEVQREAIVRKLGPFGRFLALAAAESGRTVNLTKIAQESGLGLSTIRGFYSVLEDTLVGFTLQPFSLSARVRLLKTPKFYFFDLGVRNALAGLPLDKRILAAEAGPLFEHWVACELFWRTSYLGRGYSLHFWRTVGGAEVDFVLKTPSEVLPIEVKYTANPRPEDASPLEHFIRLHPRSCRRGFVVCRTSRIERLSKRVQAVPWAQI